MCSITPETAKVGSSYSHMRGPCIGCWFSHRSNCSHWSFEAAVLPINPNIYTDQWEPIVIYHSITLLVLIQLCSPRCWHLDSNSCRASCRQSQLRFILSPLLLHLRLLGTFQSDIPLFTLIWSATHSPSQGWESTHRLHLYTLGGVFYSPSIEHWVGGTSILPLTRRTNYQYHCITVYYWLQKVWPSWTMQDE